MIARYTLPEMGRLWEEEHKLRCWLKVEVAACEAMAERGEIPKEAVSVIRQKADFDLARVGEIEARVRHDVIAFLTAVGEKVGPESKYIHLGLTSSDMLDTATAIQLVQASDLLIGRVVKLREVLARRAHEFKMTPMIGRTHGIHAEPTTFGLKLALWYDEMGRDLA
ncbi:MAG TPA: lyase family protein, partial [Patescibacteria group bacterium]|nr:lyase family protein [Patescibacteria group bacterium]